jgi:hypothetical protein
MWLLVQCRSRIPTAKVARMDTHGVETKVNYASWLYQPGHQLTNARTVVLLFILHLLYDIKPEQRAKAQAGLLAMPLPADRLIWQAEREEDWNREYDGMLKRRKQRDYLTYRDLVTLGSDGGLPRDMDSVRMQDLNAWMVNADSFGILVMMAASSV